MRRIAPYAFALLVSVVACGGGDMSTEQTSVAHPVDPAEPEILERPFTAEEIRDEWVTGLILMVRRSDPEGIVIERWTVIETDDDGADIEYVTTDDSGNPTGEPSIKRSTWGELRDHAAFPATHASRDWVKRSTQIGELEGWLYRVSNPDTTAVQEFFFAEKVPGAPVQMRIFDGDSTIYEFEQFMRMRPVTN